MIPQPVQGSTSGATATQDPDRFSDPAYRASVREQARRLKEMSSLDEEGLFRVADLPGRIADLRREWSAASALGFRFPSDQLASFEQRRARLDLRDGEECGFVMLIAIGMTESMARSMNGRLPPAERLNVEWSPPECLYGVRHHSGHLLPLPGPGGILLAVDSRMLQYRRRPPP